MEFKARTRASTQRGLISMTLLILSPLFISIFFLSVSMIIALKHHTKAYSLCYQTGVGIQEKLKIQIQSLFLMNKPAQALRIERALREQLLLVALSSANPLAIQEAQIQLKKVKLKQKKIRIIQQRILQQSQILIQKEWMTYKYKSRNWVQNYQKKQIKPPIAVAPYPKNSDSPSYKLVDDFLKKQSIKIFWTMSIFKFIPRWIRSSLNLHQHSQHNCSVSLRGKGNIFYIQLMKPNLGGLDET